MSSRTEAPTKVESTAQEQQPAVDEKPAVKENKATATATSNAPLAPPPRPTQNPATSSDAPDYFNTVHNPFSLEPNVFEQSFGNPSAETPGGRPILPPVANITSPAPLPGITPGWQSSLRSGPLSPAMLSGPTSQTDYFSSEFRGFPTPNESSLRTGLTPGGGGSMFPQPSPNTQAIYNLQSGGVTPSTADFQQSAMRAAAQAKQIQFPTTSAPTSQPEAVTAGMEHRENYQQLQQGQQQQRGQNDPFANHDVSNAANDLLSFATQNGNRNGASFGMPNQQQQVNNLGHMPVQPVQENGRRNTKGSINSMQSADTAEFSESGGSEQAKATTRSRAAKKGSANGKGAANKRKAEDTPKGGKKAKGNTGAPISGPDDDEMGSDDENQLDENGKKMTDEEKRKNFLERNRIAALKCRQRKKQWLANLQAKVELFSTENDALSGTVTQLREEIVNLKTLLLAHKDCPVSQAQGLSGMNMNSFLGGDVANHQNPYGIAQMQPNGVHMGMPMQPGTQMQNRFVYPTPRMLKHEDEENAQYAQNFDLQPSS
ncbi:Aft1 HRA domain-containing protein [Lophiotrema nucula]|uniref:Aft1 HRA domain-containing protein n=1 Tax=Lophiotrema nucula TaxID=690887 RepID=A0A6A5ZKL1_9PLEO|nr:Aft1 HRA domain-containing protein [Lophiotrema nucula]